MTPEVKKEVTRRLAKIESGKFGLDDTKLLFLNLRDSLHRKGKPTELLFDIFHFVAHPNAREKGAMFEVCKAKVKKTIYDLKSSDGFTLEAEPVILDVAGTLNDMIEELGITHDAKKLQTRSKELTMHVYKILQATPMAINDELVERVSIEYDKVLDCPLLSFKMNPFDYGHVNGEPTLRFRIL